MKVLASVGYLLQLSQALKKNDDYDYLDFWALIEKLEKRTTDSLRMAARDNNENFYSKISTKWKI